MTDYSPWIRVGGAMQLAILIASALVPFVLDWRSELRKLPVLLRQLVWVHGAFVALTISGLGVVSLVNARELAEGGALARSLCAFISIFWGTRLAVQWCYFAPNEHLSRVSLKVGYHLLTVTFVCLTVVYAWGAVRSIPGHPT